MDSTIFAQGHMNKFDVVTILMVGITATTWLMAIRWFLEKFGVVRLGTGRIIGSFLIPWNAKVSAFDFGFQFAIGLGFTYAYAFAFHFVIPDSIWSFIKIGMTVGLVHGFFISLFTVTMGFSGRGTADGTRPFEFVALPANVAAQAIFGAIVGAGYGYAELTSSFWRFMAIILVIEALLIGIGLGYVSKRRDQFRFETARQH